MWKVGTKKKEADKEVVIGSSGATGWNRERMEERIVKRGRMGGWGVIS